MGSARVGVLMSCCALWGVMSITPARAQNAMHSTQNDSGQAQGFKIAGTVVNAVTGGPLERVRVSIANTRARARRIEMVTAAGGHFEFTGLPAGKYSLQGARRGYLTSSYQQHEQYSTAIVTGLEFTTDNLVLKVMPMAMITGHALDESGEPVRHARVQLFLEDHSAGMTRVVRTTGGSSTDDRGYFDFAVLRPGRYFVSVSATPWYAVHPSTAQAGGETPGGVSPALDVAYPTTYYGGGTESDGAAPIDLKGGDKQEIEIRLQPVPALHLIVHVPVEASSNTSDQQNVYRFPVLQKRVFDSLEYVNPGQVQTLSPGVLEVTGIAAGRYDVGVRSSNPEEAQRFGEIDLEHDGQDLNVAEGETLAKLTVKLKGEEALPKQYAVALRDARQRIVSFAQGETNRQVSFPAVKPGKYAILVMAPGKFYAVTRTNSAAGEGPGHEVNVVSGASIDVTAQLVEGVAEIEGVVEKKGKPIGGVMVALVPNEPDSHLELLRRDQSDFDGTFLLRGVIPGTYTIVAVEDAWGFEWLKAGALTRYVQHGQSVIIGEKMRGTVHLPEAVELQGK